MKKLCLIGADGQLGTEITLALRTSENFNCTALSIKDLDLSDSNQVKQYFTDNAFDFVINCAAFTAVDLAEKETITNNTVNNLAVQTLSKACAVHQAFLIHISTDFVFDGTKSTPMVETDPTNPLQAYGVAKLAGEKWIEYGVVIRTSWLYSPFGNNFVKTMMRLGEERDRLNVVDNQVGTPTYAFDLAQTIIAICSDDQYEAKKGVYHYSNEGVASWYDFAKSIMEYSGISCQLMPIPDSEYPTPAKRPNYSVLDKSKIKRAFELEIPYWRESLKHCIKRIKNDECRN